MNRFNLVPGPTQEVLVASPGLAAGFSGGMGRLPAMGWNSWNEYACDINEGVFLETGELMVSLGLRDLGYEYVNIDDCWSDKERRRDDETKRIVVDSEKFPRGISYVADEIHKLGLKVGIYSDAGTLTCGGYEGSLGYEDIDAATWAEWGIDYLKYDNCNIPPEWADQYPYDPALTSNPVPPRGYDYARSNTSVRFSRMRDALQQQSRLIHYSLCAWGHAHVERWGHETGHSWRMWGDILPQWAGRAGFSWGIMPIVNQAARHWEDSSFWGHNDWDMLEVGNGDLTFEENRSHFALWAALKSPLIIGTPLKGIDRKVLGILSNKELIDFSQDTHYSDSARPFGLEGPVPPTVDDTAHPPSHWVGISVKGIHVFLLNTGAEEAVLAVEFDKTPGLNKQRVYLVHDMWTGEDLGVFLDGFALSVKAHDTAALRFTTPQGNHPDANWAPGESERSEGGD
uniref:Alpha-galactosidase n=1 Tax=Bionectria ochroleuca TaxID=29856 RepID=A0A8H7N278_BIOOC